MAIDNTDPSRIGSGVEAPFPNVELREIIAGFTKNPCVRRKLFIGGGNLIEILLNPCRGLNICVDPVASTTREIIAALESNNHALAIGLIQQISDIPEEISNGKLIQDIGSLWDYFKQYQDSSISCLDKSIETILIHLKTIAPVVPKFSQITCNYPGPNHDIHLAAIQVATELLSKDGVFTMVTESQRIYGESLTSVRLLCQRNIFSHYTVDHLGPNDVPESLYGILFQNHRRWRINCFG